MPPDTPATPVASGSVALHLDGTRERLRLLRRISTTFDDETDLRTQLESVLRQLAEHLDDDAMSLCLAAPSAKRDDLCASFVRKDGGAVETALLRTDRGLGARVRREGLSLRLEDARTDAEYGHTLEHAFGVQTRALLLVPLRRRREVVGLLAAIRERAEGFDESDQELLEAATNDIVIAAENDSLLRELTLDVAERELLLQVSREIGGRTLELDSVLQEIFDGLLQVVPFDAAAIFLVDEDTGELRAAAQRGYPPDQVSAGILGEESGIVRLTLRTSCGHMIDQVADHPDYVEARPTTQSEMAVPIVSGGQTIGVVNLESDTPAFYGERDLRVAELIASQVASPILTARLHGRTLAHAQFQRDLELSREIQLSLLPSEPLRLPDFEAAGVNVPSSAVGGDYFDAIEVDENRVLLVLADVSGHGLSAALLMASVRTGVRLLVGPNVDPAALCTRLNHLIYEASSANQYVAAVFSLLDRRSGELLYCNAGHLPPVRLGRSRTEYLYGGGLPLGLFADSEYATHRVQLTGNESLAFFTDGLTDTADACDESFGIDRLLAALREGDVDGPSTAPASPEAMIDAVRRAVRRFRGRQGDHPDDLTLMIARWLGSRGASARAAES